VNTSCARTRDSARLLSSECPNLYYLPQSAGFIKKHLAGVVRQGCEEIAFVCSSRLQAALQTPNVFAHRQDGMAGIWACRPSRSMRKNTAEAGYYELAEGLGIPPDCANGLYTS